MKGSALPWFAATSVVCFGCDQAAKELARLHLDAAATFSLLHGFIELRLAENRGAFLSLGAGLPDQFRTFLFQAVVPLALAGFCLAYLRRASALDAVAIALIVGGGAGNWVDRLMNDGAVTDFVQMGVGLFHTGVFNLADVAIVIGAALLLLQRSNRVGSPDLTPPERDAS